ncbi:MAG: hypothetical protein ACRC6I_19885 [Paracoccaceae bacterium]
MKHALLAFLAGVAATPAAADPQPIVGYFALVNRGGEKDFDEAMWERVLLTIDQRVFWQAGPDQSVADRTLEMAATATNSPAFATLTVDHIPLPVRDGVPIYNEPQEPLETAIARFEAATGQPACTLLQATTASETARPGDYSLITWDRDDIRFACYRSVALIVLADPEKHSAPMPDEIVTDTGAAAKQSAMPPLAVSVAFFLDKKASFVAGASTPRADAVFAPGEQITLMAQLENVGRTAPGTPSAAYDINLAITVADAAGKVIYSNPEAWRFDGVAAHQVPIPEDYFQNGVESHMQFPAPGTYQITYEFRDLTRPESETAPVEIVKDVTIAQ